MGVRFIPDEKTLNTIKEMAEQGCTIRRIALTVNIDRSTAKRIIEQNGFVLKSTPENRSGKKYDWGSKKLEELKKLYNSDQYSLDDIAEYFNTSKSTIVKKAVTMRLKKVKKVFFTEDKNDFLRAHVEEMNINELAKGINADPWSVGKQLAKLGIRDKVPKKKFFVKGNRQCYKTFIMMNPDYESDLKNPMYSHAFIARKYGISVSKVSKDRKKKFKNFKEMVDTYLCKSTAEIDFENILLDLRLSYLYEFIVDEWKVDYNLGFNLLVEIQGEYWHNIDKVKEKDIKKFKELENKGYTVLEIWENELKEPEKVKEKILKQLRENIKTYYGSLNLVNL